jgi:hypothetical protein
MGYFGAEGGGGGEPNDVRIVKTVEHHVDGVGAFTWSDGVSAGELALATDEVAVVDAVTRAWCLDIVNGYVRDGNGDNLVDISSSGSRLQTRARFWFDSVVGLWRMDYSVVVSGTYPNVDYSILAPGDPSAGLEISFEVSPPPPPSDAVQLDVFAIFAKATKGGF